MSIPPVSDVSSTPGFAEGEETVSVNPHDTRNVIVGSNQWQPLTNDNAGNVSVGPGGFTTCAVWASHDGGRTWSGGAINAAGQTSYVVPPAVAQQPIVRDHVPSEFDEPGNLISADQNTVWDRHGNVYYECLFAGTRTADAKVLVFRSGDGGVTWSRPYEAFSEASTQIQIDRPFIAIDDSGGPRDGTLYLGFETMFYQAYLPRVYERASTDGGQTWGPIVRVDEDGPNSAQWDPRERPVVGPDGTLHIVYDAAQFVSVAPIDPEATPIEVMVASSTDGGRTFRQSMVEPNVRRIVSPDEAEPFFTETIPAIATDPHHAGRLAVAWPDVREGPARILLRTSSDGGRSWRAPLDVSDDPVRVANQHDHVQLTYLPDGRLVVVWRDRRFTGGSFDAPFDVFARAFDVDSAGRLTPGRTVRVTSASQPPTTSHRGNMPSEYLDAAGSSAGVHVAWDEMAGGLPDNVYRLIPMAAFGPERTAPAKRPAKHHRRKRHSHHRKR
ncbi:MAG: sialidase family protein [Thermoleophilaceae bacterium]